MPAKKDPKTGLTEMQTQFCRAYIETKGNATAAYKLAYNTENQLEATISNNAYMLLQNSEIIANIDKLRELHAKRHMVTVDSLTEEYNEAKQIAYDLEQVSSAVSAINGKAKIHGFDKQVIDNTIKGKVTVEQSVVKSRITDLLKKSKNETS